MKRTPLTRKTPAKIIVITGYVDDAGDMKTIAQKIKIVENLPEAWL